MRILMSADYFYPAPTAGPGNAIYGQAKALTVAGHDITVVAIAQGLPPSIPRNRWLTLDCGRVIYTRNPHAYLPLVHCWYAGWAMRGVDVVHVNSLFYPASVVLVMLARLLGKRVIWSLHGELSPQALSYSPRRKKILLPLLRWAGRDVQFHATCRGEDGHVRAQFGPTASVRVTPNRMVLPEVVERVARPYLLFVGRLHPIKAIDRLLEALSTSALFRWSPYTLTIAGPDATGYRKTLVGQVQTLGLVDKVQFIGPVQDDAKEQLYADALVTILPSHSENFGLVVIESLAQGTPVIAATGTPWAQLETERAGSWVVNDPDRLRSAIEHYLTMPADEYEGYRTRAAELARRDFDVMANVGEWVRFYSTTQVKIVRSSLPQPA